MSSFFPLLQVVTFLKVTVPWQCLTWQQECYGDDWNNAPWRLVRAATELFKEKPGQEVVVVSQVLSHEVNRGYTFVPELLHQVNEVNGEKVDSLSHMVDLVESNKEDTLRIVTTGDMYVLASATLDRRAILRQAC